jgi:hypothetical protein
MHRRHDMASILSGATRIVLFAMFIPTVAIGAPGSTKSVGCSHIAGARCQKMVEEARKIRLCDKAPDAQACNAGLNVMYQDCKASCGNDSFTPPGPKPKPKTDPNPGTTPDGGGAR